MIMRCCAEYRGWQEGVTMNCAGANGPGAHRAGRFIVQLEALGEHGDPVDLDGALGGGGDQDQTEHGGPGRDGQGGGFAGAGVGNRHPRGGDG